MLNYYIKTTVKSVISPIADSLGFYGRLTRKRCVESSSLLVPMYHRVIESTENDPFHLGMCVRRDNFIAQLNYLKDRFNPVCLGEAVNAMRAGEKLSQNSMAITFDDGYIDNLETALPILEKAQLPWTLFVVTGGIDNDEPFWWDQVIDILANTKKANIDLADLGLEGESKILSFKWTRRRTTAIEILERYWQLPHSQIKDYIEKLTSLLGKPDRKHIKGGRRMSSGQIRELHKRGVEIGAHTVRHPNLTLLERTRILEEMRESKSYLENLLQTDIPGFAYPAGIENELVAQCAKEVGFSYVAGTQSALNTTPYYIWSLRRMGMPDTGVADFKRCMSKLAH